MALWRGVFLFIAFFQHFHKCFPTLDNMPHRKCNQRHRKPEMNAANSGIRTFDYKQKHQPSYSNYRKCHRKQCGYRAFGTQAVEKQTFIPTPMIADMIYAEPEKQSRRNNVRQRPVFPNLVRRVEPRKVKPKASYSRCHKDWNQRQIGNQTTSVIAPFSHSFTHFLQPTQLSGFFT